MKIKSLTIALVLTISLAGCDKSPEPQKADTTKITGAVSTSDATENSKLPANAPTYKMAVDANYAPFAFKDEKGQSTGFDIELIKAIGEKQGFKVEVLSDQWAGIFDRLNDNSRDLVGSGVVANPDRATKMDFSDPYLQVTKTATFLASNTSINTFDDLKSKKVAVQESTSNESDFKEFMGGTAPNLVTYPTSFLAFQNVIRGTVDANFDNGLLNQYYINTIGKNNNLTFKSLPIPNKVPDNLVFAIKKGNTKLITQINTGLAEVKKDGTYDKIYKKWFGETPQTFSTSVSATASSTPTTK